MAEAAVTFLVEQLKEVVIGYKDLITGEEKELQQLIKDLELVKAFLKETAEKKKKDNLLKVFERRIRDVVYEVEDAIDTCLNKVATSRRPALSRTSLAEQIKEIREDKVVPLLDDANKFANMQKIVAEASGGDEYPSTRSTTRDLPIRRNKVVGFDDQEEIITGYLMDKTEKLDIISIVGIPGLGKTTLAWKIYQREDIGYHFPIRIWVCISQVLNRRDVLLQILRKFAPSQDMSSLSDDELIQLVRSYLAKVKFLLVLDDIWSVDAWRSIQEALPVDNGNGKVLITSREHDIGLHSKVYRDPHWLRFLNDTESWMLLQYEVFGSSEECPKDLASIGHKIAMKCNGVPLTIVVIGGILTDQLSKSRSTAQDEWKMVADNVSDVLQHDGAQRITDVVALSYNRLPDDMKECFIYLGIFPEDYEIPVKMLCGLWISEGLVLPKTGKRSLEESAEEILNDLICRNLLKVEKTNHMGEVKTCRVHDMIRAFCIAKSKEENSFQAVKRSRTGSFEPSPTEIQNSCRLCFHSDLSRFLSQNPSAEHVRSFLCFYDQPAELEKQHIKSIADGFPKLRILESNCIKFHQFPAKITKLIHLRYLTLNIDTLTTLPQPIVDLWNLQSLVIKTKSRTIVMKANIWKMIRLRYLVTNAVIVLDSIWEGDAGQSLHTLNRLSAQSCNDVVARKARNLKTLGISGKLANIFKTTFLEELHHLEKLKLVNSLAYERHEDLLHGFPQRNCFPPNLKRLTLTNTFLGWPHMSTLSMIKSLEALKLKDNAFAGVSWNLGRDVFPNLQLLLLVNISELILWEASEEAFPKLRFLVVKNCENLKEIPESLGTHLEKLEIDRVRTSVVDSARKIEEAKMYTPKGIFGVQFKLTIGPGCETN